MLDPSEYELDVSFDATHEELLLSLCKLIFGTLSSANLRANRLESKPCRQVVGTCLVCKKALSIAKWGVCLACISQLEVDMLAKNFNVMILKDNKGKNVIVEMFVAQAK